MSEDIQHVRETSTRTGDTVQKDTEVRNTLDGDGHMQNVAARVIWFIAGLLLSLLAFRFLFSLLGANTSNGIANFVYNTSHPFVAPFFSLFRYNNVTYGVSHFEIYTLVAMLFYGLVAWGIARLATLNRD